MELILAFVLGVAAGFAGVVSAMRRANKNPKGTTARVVKIMGGGGGGPQEPA